MKNVYILGLISFLLSYAINSFCGECMITTAHTATSHVPAAAPMVPQPIQPVGSSWVTTAVTTTSETPVKKPKVPRRKHHAKKHVQRAQNTKASSPERNAPIDSIENK